MRRLFYFSFFLLLISCNAEETSLDLRIPEGVNTLWRYEVYKLASDTTRVGILDVINQGLGEHQGRSNVLIQERQMQLDSLQNGPNSILRSTIYQQNAGDAIDYFAADPFAVFDEMFRSEIFDTLTAGIAGETPFQNFRDYIPGWTTSFKFSESARFSYSVLDRKRYYLNFRHDLDTLTGYVEVGAFALFSGLEQISIPFDESTLAYRMKTTLQMDFAITKNRTQILAPYRKTVVMTSWFHTEYGLVRRSREPFSLFLPDYPTRYPIVSFPGERWDLILYFPGIE